jgi:hypothetical protein
MAGGPYGGGLGWRLGLQMGGAWVRGAYIRGPMGRYIPCILRGLCGSISLSIGDCPSSWELWWVIMHVSMLSSSSLFLCSFK